MDTTNGTSGPFCSSLIRSLVAIGLMLTSGCDEASTDQASVLEADQWRSAAVSPSVTSMAASNTHTWALLDDGSIKGWGEFSCQSGDCLLPAQIAPLTFHAPAVELHAHDDRVLTRLADGVLLTWTADPTGISTPSPVTFEHSAPIAQIALGSGFGCARFDNGRVDCQSLGAVTATPSLDGMLVEEGAMDLAAGDSHACMVLATGDVECRGDATHGQLGLPSPNGGHVIELSGPALRVIAGADHNCALLASGAVECWGRNDHGQLGHTGAGVGAVPIPTAVELTAGTDHTCAITAPNQDLYCWGSDDLGQLGMGETTSGVRRIDLDGLSTKVVFSGPSARTTFAILEDEGLRGWGENDLGQLGYGDDSAPFVEGLTVGQRNSLAVGKYPDIIIYDGEDA